MTYAAREVGFLHFGPVEPDMRNDTSNSIEEDFLPPCQICFGPLQNAITFNTPLCKYHNKKFARHYARDGADVYKDRPLGRERKPTTKWPF